MIDDLIEDLVLEYVNWYRANFDVTNPPVELAEITANSQVSRQAKTVSFVKKITFFYIFIIFFTIYLFFFFYFILLCIVFLFCFLI